MCVTYERVKLVWENLFHCFFLTTLALSFHHMAHRVDEGYR